MTVRGRGRRRLAAEICDQAATDHRKDKAIPLRFEIELISSESVGQTSTPTRKPVTSNVVRIPSSSELKQGAKPEVLSKDQIEKLKKEK